MNDFAGQTLIQTYREARFIEARFWDLDRLGSLLKETRQFDAAAEQYQFLLRYQPDHANLHNNYGNVLMDLHRLDEAIAEYDLAFRYNPQRSSAYHNIGLCLSQQKKFDVGPGNCCFLPL